MKLRNWIAIAVVTSLLAGCGAGKNFTMPAKGSLQLGVTTPAPATPLLGDPVNKSTSTIGSVETGMATLAPSISTLVKLPGTYANLQYTSTSIRSVSNWPARSPAFARREPCTSSSSMAG